MGMHTQHVHVAFARQLDVGGTTGLGHRGEAGVGGRVVIALHEKALAIEIRDPIAELEHANPVIKGHAVARHAADCNRRRDFVQRRMPEVVAPPQLGVGDADHPAGFVLAGSNTDTTLELMDFAAEVFGGNPPRHDRIGCRQCIGGNAVAHIGVVGPDAGRGKQHLREMNRACFDEFDGQPDTTRVGRFVQTIPMRKDAGDESFADFVVFFGATHLEDKLVLGSEKTTDIDGMRGEVALV